MNAESLANILVVDDEPMNIRILQIQLQTQGYTVSTALDGIEALERVKTEKPDLVLMDINMPRMDGFEAVEHLREEKTTEFIPIIMITAMRDTRENRIRAIEVGADDFIEKPFDSLEVLARVRSLLRIKQYHDNPGSPQRALGRRTANGTQHSGNPAPPKRPAGIRRVPHRLAV